MHVCGPRNILRTCKLHTFWRLNILWPQMSREKWYCEPWSFQLLYLFIYFEFCTWFFHFLKLGFLLLSCLSSAGFSLAALSPLLLLHLEINVFPYIETWGCDSIQMVYCTSLLVQNSLPTYAQWYKQYQLERTFHKSVTTVNFANALVFVVQDKNVPRTCK